jgi:hypothetical protein
VCAGSDRGRRHESDHAEHCGEEEDKAGVLDDQVRVGVEDEGLFVLDGDRRCRPQCAGGEEKRAGEGSGGEDLRRFNDIALTKSSIQAP